MQYIAFDSHKRYTLARVEGARGGAPREARIPHHRGALAEFLATCERGSPVAVETIGNWYWIVDEIEESGFVPQLVHAKRAKQLRGGYNKSDRLDAKGLVELQRNGTLPAVWIPPGPLRDLRDLPRTRMLLVRERTRVKCRIQSTLAKYAIRIEEVSDVFGKRGRELLSEALGSLPRQTAFTTELLLARERRLEQETRFLERRMQEAFADTEEIALLQSLPGVGFILAIVIATEIGTVDRFARPGNLASYCGLVPRLKASGGKIRHGRGRPDINRYLKWAFVEAGNSVCAQRARYPFRHSNQLYERVVKRKGHASAVVAVGRHLAEATYWMLTKNERYRDPSLKRSPSTRA